MRKHHRQFDASTGASGPHDFAVRISAARLATSTRPPQPAPTPVTLANAPLLGTGWPHYAGDLRQESRSNSENQKCLISPAFPATNKEASPLMLSLRVFLSHACGS